MTKQNKIKVEKPKKEYNIKSKMNGLYSLIVGIAELVTIYMFVTQDNQVLWVLAGIFIVDASFRFGSKFIK
jgi:hypothetical protein